MAFSILSLPRGNSARLKTGAALSKEEIKSLVSELKDKSRDVAILRDRAIVPLKFDEDGDPLTNETFDPRKHLKNLSLTDLRFLKTFRETGWNAEETIERSDMLREKSIRLIKKLQVFKQEDERVKALADIPTGAWISAKHTENVFDGKLDDSQRDSLKELAKITGSYKQQNTVSQVNVFNISLTPEQEEKLKPVFDTIALEKSDAA